MVLHGLVGIGKRVALSAYGMVRLFAVTGVILCIPFGAEAAPNDSSSKQPGATAAKASVESAPSVPPAVAVTNGSSTPAATAKQKPAPALKKKSTAKKVNPAEATPSAKKASAPKKGSANGKSKATPAKATPARATSDKAVAKAVAKEAPPVVTGFPVSEVPPFSAKDGATLPVAETWQPLMLRLQKDGIEASYLRSMFGRMGTAYSHMPMGTKVAELFKIKYVPRTPRTTPASKSDTPPVYKNMLKPEIVLRCKGYLEQHAKAFALMEKQYGVPKEIVASLLMVETRHGAFLGKNSAFWSLACMAAADTPERVEAVFPELPLPMTPDKEGWLKKILQERSAWAQKELLALIVYSKANGLDPLAMPGSVYGAIGICQFMPSNLSPFAVDGNMDGVISLFEPVDAIFSVGNYLKEHGWVGADFKEKDRDGHHASLKRYNKSNVYANTILALADAIVAPPEDADAAGAAVAAKPGDGKTVAKKAPVEKAKKTSATAPKKQGAKKTAKSPSAEKGGAKPSAKKAKEKAPANPAKPSSPK